MRVQFDVIKQMVTRREHFLVRSPPFFRSESKVGRNSEIHSFSRSIFRGKSRGKKEESFRFLVYSTRDRTADRSAAAKI